MIPRARIVRASDAAGAEVAPLSLRPRAAHWRRIAREEIEARLEAERLVQEAKSQAEAIVIRARDEAKSEAARAVREAEEQADAKIAVRWLALGQAEAMRLERNSERIIAVGAVLAERLLGAALELAP